MNEVATSNQTKKKILIVDDEPAFAMILKMSLEDTGAYLVRVENSGGAGLRAAREFCPAVTILDVTMPDMLGTAVAAELRRDPAFDPMPIIFLTATQRADSDVTGADEFAYISKPASLKDVLFCIRKSLDNPIHKETL